MAFLHFSKDKLNETFQINIIRPPFLKIPANKTLLFLISLLLLKIIQYYEQTFNKKRDTYKYSFGRLKERIQNYSSFLSI